MLNTIPRILTALTLTLVVLAGCSTVSNRPGKVPSTAGAYSNRDIVAVLLPQSGRYASAARAVRDGILAAQHVHEQGQRPQVRFYDSSDPGSTAALLRRAAAEGATRAIGPLQKASVDNLARSAALPIPTLALNRATTDAIPANLYQFALSPEDEAVEVANKAWQRGYRTVLMLYPDGGWGERISSGFRHRWSALGGRVAAERRYDPAAGDYYDTISALFTQATGTADFMLLVTTAKTARRLWPQVQAAGGAGLPVFSTSHIYGGSFDPRADGALVGLQFVDIPWLLAPDASDPLSRERLQISLSGLEDRFTRLYAMGIDAYSLSPYLTWMAENPGSYLDGRTGRLSLDTRRLVRRELMMARMDIVGPARMTHVGSGAERFAQAASTEPRIASLHP